MQGYVILAIVIVGGVIALFMDFSHRRKYAAMSSVNPGVEYPNNHHGLISHERTHRSQKSFTTRGPLETLSRDPSQRT